MRLTPLLLAAALIGGTALSQGAMAQAIGNRNDTLQNNAGTRALDRAAGTDVSGAYPSQRDGTPANPPGTAAGRALDRAAGTNTSGAYPQQSDGTPGNPPGTALGRAIDGAAGRPGASPIR